MSIRAFLRRMRYVEGDGRRVFAGALNGRIIIRALHAAFRSQILTISIVGPASDESLYQISSIACGEYIIGYFQSEYRKNRNPSCFVHDEASPLYS